MHYNIFLEAGKSIFFANKLINFLIGNEDEIQFLIPVEYQVSI